MYKRNDWIKPLTTHIQHTVNTLRRFPDYGISEDLYSNILKEKQEHKIIITDNYEENLLDTDPHL